MVNPFDCSACMRTRLGILAGSTVRQQRVITTVSDGGLECFGCLASVAVRDGPPSGSAVSFFIIGRVDSSSFSLAMSSVDVLSRQ